MTEVENGRYEIVYKADGSPVTKSDKWLENAIRSILERRHPDIEFVGEESFDPARWYARRGLLAMLDPIDGTENFCSGLKEWGVSLGIWNDGSHLGSMLLLPELGE